MSEDSLKLMPQNYSLKDLIDHIKTKLGGAVWRLEGMGLDQNGTILTAIGEAVSRYSVACPIPKFRVLRVNPNKKEWDLSAEADLFGVGRVDFIKNNLTISPIINSTLGISPILNMEARDFDLFLRWRKTFMRVTSTEAKWSYDDNRKVLSIFCPIPGVMAGVTTYHVREFDKVKLSHKDWLKRYSVACARALLGEHRSKFDDIIPAPGRDIKLNGTKLLDQAKEEKEKLETELLRFATRPVAVWS